MININRNIITFKKYVNKCFLKFYNCFILFYLSLLFIVLTIFIFLLYFYIYNFFKNSFNLILITFPWPFKWDIIYSPLGILIIHRKLVYYKLQRSSERLLYRPITIFYRNKKTY